MDERFSMTHVTLENAQSIETILIGNNTNRYKNIEGIFVPNR